MSKKKPPIEVPEGCRVIFRPYRTDPVSGKVLYARDFGLRAWPIIVRGE